MNNVLNIITQCLEFCLNSFQKIFDFVNSNPILGISVYLPLAIMLITAVFKLVGSIFNKNSAD